MATFTDAHLNALADNQASLEGLIGAHTGDPGPSGVLLEASGGGYARVNPAWLAGGVVGPLGAAQPATVGVAWGEVTISLAAGTYTHLAIRKADGTFLGSQALAVPEVLASAGSAQFPVATGPGPTGSGV